MMKSYDEVVTNMICFLKNRNICQSSINSHKDCYRSFQRFIQKNNCQWEQSAVSSWITELRKTNTRQLCTVWNQYMRQLDEYCHTGTVEDRHLYLTLTLYERLGGGMKPDLDDYLWTCKSRYSKRSWHLAQNYLAGMLIYFEDRGRYSVSEISYQDIIAYQASDFSCSRKTRAVYLGHARRFFEFMSLKHKCPAGYALYLDDRNAPYVGSLENFDAGLRTRIAAVADESRDFPADEFYCAVNEYIGSLKAHKYAATSIKTAKHALTVLYLFMDIHSLGYHPEIAAAWFSGIRDLLPKNWKHWRRLVFLFSEFAECGDIIPSSKFTYVPGEIDLLPAWCRSGIEGFLDLLRREFHTVQTIRSYQYPCIRLCRYLMDRDLSGFEQLDPDILYGFCAQDRHRTFRGRSSCFGIIRRFLVFLEDTGYIENRYLHLCIDPGCAPGEKLVDILTKDQTRRIEQYRKLYERPIELRRAAMVMTGIKMGLRASDVVNLKLTDIDWENRCISIIQEKTKTSLILPMPVSAGNAIYKYIRFGRPDTDSVFVFVRHKAPYGKLSIKTCTIALWSILPERKGVYGGFHVTRRTFATNILRNGAGAGRIMDALGHTDPTSVMKYLSMDEDRMRLCPLMLSDLSLNREEV